MSGSSSVRGYQSKRGAWVAGYALMGRTIFLVFSALHSRARNMTQERMRGREKEVEERVKHKCWEGRGTASLVWDNTPRQESVTPLAWHVTPGGRWKGPSAAAGAHARRCEGSPDGQGHARVRVGAAPFPNCRLSRRVALVRFLRQPR